MPALTADRNTARLDGDVDEYPVLASTKIFAGSMVVLDASGWAKPAVTATGLVAAGRAEHQADNSAGANGDISVKVRRGAFKFANSADADEITKAEIGDTCYIVDDQTVAKTASGKSPAGLIVSVDDQGVGVFMGYGPLLAPGGALLAANNLSDVGTAATARSNLGTYEKLGTPTIVVGAAVGDVINVAIQLTDSDDADLAVRGSVFAYLSDDANGDSVAGTAPSAGVAIGTDGLAIPLVADKAFQLVSEADGDIDLNIEEAGADTWYLILVMPDGRTVASNAITFA
ncbi:MAG: hypothetical protein WD036_04760 [Bauldia sp.]